MIQQIRGQLVVPVLGRRQQRGPAVVVAWLTSAPGVEQTWRTPGNPRGRRNQRGQPAAVLHRLAESEMRERWIRAETFDARQEGCPELQAEAAQTAPGPSRRPASRSATSSALFVRSRRLGSRGLQRPPPQPPRSRRRRRPAPKPNSGAAPWDWPGCCAAYRRSGSAASVDVRAVLDQQFYGGRVRLLDAHISGVVPRSFSLVLT